MRFSLTLTFFCELPFKFPLNYLLSRTPGHNDVNQKNLIWNPQTRTLQFIDFEMSMNNYLAFEIGQVKRLPK